MDLAQTLINKLREIENEAGKAKSGYTEVVSHYELTQGAQENEQTRLYNGLSAAYDVKLAEGLSAIEEQAAHIDQEEKREQDRRALDANYLSRLASKLAILDRIGSAEIDVSKMRDMFAEFENDTFAVTAIKAALSPMVAEQVAPADHTGEKSAHLRGAVAQGFRNAAAAARRFNAPADIAQFDTGKNAIVENFIAYCMKQDMHFSRPDSEIWAELSAGAPAAGAEGASFNFSFKPANAR